MRARFVAALVAMVMVTPSAAAIAVSLQVSPIVAPIIEGRSTFTYDEGVLDLAPVIASSQPIEMVIGAASGAHVSYQGSRLLTSSPVPDEERPLDLAAGTIRIESCQAACRVFLVPDGGWVALDATDPSLGRLDQPKPFSTKGTPRNDWPEVSRTFEAGELVVSGSREQGISAGGDLILVMTGATATWEGPGGPRPLDTRDVDQAPGGAVTTKSYVSLRIRDVNVTIVHPAARLYGPASFLLDGTLRSETVTGSYKDERRERRLDAEPIEITGRFQIDLDGREAIRAVGPTSADGELSGEATSVVLTGLLVVEPGTIGASVRPATVGLVAFALLLALLRLIPFLYTRVGRTQVLSNPNRSRTFGRLQASPGMTLAQLSRELALARIVVQHHLRMLQSHGLVTSQAFGRRRLWFAGPVPPGGALIASRGILSDETRRSIAALIAAEGGATQRIAVERLGLRQRLVSHHIAKLTGAGLVTSDGVNPRVYRPTPLLVEALLGLPTTTAGLGDGIS